MTPPVVSQEAEDSCRLLNQTLAAHQDAVRALRSLRTAPRIIGAFDSAQVQRQATLLRLVSIAEAFAAQTLRAIAEPWAEGSELVVHEAWTAQLDKELSGWADFPNTYKKRLGIKPSDAPWTEMHGYTDARNVIAHGLGTLTTRQRNQSTRDKLTSVGVAPVNDRITLTEDVLVTAAEACRTFIEQLDLTVTRLYHSLHTD